jgi:DNA-binding IclR family transcriptional regulator
VRALLESIRNTGVTTYVSEETGIGGVAAPIFDATGICATLALLGTLVTTSSERHPERPEQVAAVAQAITREMGGAAFFPFRQP